MGLEKQRSHPTGGRYYFLFFLILYTSICASVAAYMMYYHVPSDLNAHIQILLRFIETDAIPTPPIYYGLVYLLHFIMPYKEGFALAAVVVLTGAGFLKYGVSCRYLYTYCPGVGLRRVSLFAFLLMFFAPITLFCYEGDLWYLAKFTPLIWHNSTTLLSLPFCVFLFYSAVKYIENRSDSVLWKILLISVIIVLIKPSFIFSFLPAFPLTLLLLDKRWSADFFKVMALGVPLAAIIIVEKILIYNTNPILVHLEDGLVGGIGIKPFFLWLQYSESLGWDIISSFMFPFVFVVAYWKRLLQDPQIILSSLLVLFGLVIYFALVETGSRLMDGNFFWQVILTLFVAYLVLVKHLLNICFASHSIDFSKKGLSLKNVFLLGLFFVHVVGGIAYTLRIVTLHNIY